MTTLPRAIEVTGETGAGISYVDYVVPGRPADGDNASLVGFAMGDRMVMVVAAHTV